METVPGSGMPPASLLWTRIASTEIIYSCGFDFMTVPGRIATGKYCQHTPRSGELLRALYTGRSSDSGIKHSCSSSQGTASMSCEQLLCQHSNGFVRDLHPFPFSPAFTGRHLYTMKYLLMQNIIIFFLSNVNESVHFT